MDRATIFRIPKDMIDGALERIRRGEQPRVPLKNGDGSTVGFADNFRIENGEVIADIYLQKDTVDKAG